MKLFIKVKPCVSMARFFQRRPSVRFRRSALLGGGRIKLCAFSQPFSTSAASLMFWRKKRNVEYDDQDSSLRFRQIELTTCVGLWADIPFCRFLVGYLDSHPGQNYNVNHPVIVGLHGMARDHNDLAPLLQSFVKMGYRVVIPNFPESPYTKCIKQADDLVFSHETYVRALFLQDFLKAVKLDRIEVMVGFSIGGYVMHHLLAHNIIQNVKSIVLISPGPHYIYSIYQPYWLVQFLTKWNERPFFQFPVRLLVLIAKRFVSGMSSSTLKQAMYQLRISAGVDFPEVPGNLIAVESLNLPTLMIYGMKDKTIIKDLAWMEEYSKLLGIKEEDLTEYDKDLKPVKKGNATAKRRRIVFQEAAHKLQLDETYQKVVLLEMWDFLNIVKAQTKQHS